MSRDGQRNVVVLLTLGLVTASLVCAIPARQGVSQLVLSGPMSPGLAKAALVFLVALIVPLFLARLWNIRGGIAAILLAVGGFAVLIVLVILTKQDHGDALWTG